MDLEGWLAWQEGLNPRLVDLGLERVAPVAARMGLDRPGAPVIAVGGTNGKGSVVAVLEALALAHGLRPGCYVSPWLLRYNESVRVAGQAVDDDTLISAFRAVESARHGVALTAFEYRTLAAVEVLRARGCDLCLLEVGLGGRLDAVNLFDARVAVITAVGLDHREWLGDTLDQVAVEKAGIARRGAPLVCCEPDTAPLLEPLAVAAGARPVICGRDYQVLDQGDHWSYRGLGQVLEGLPLPALDGRHQLANAAGALSAFALCAMAAPDPRRVAGALREVRLPGRLQRLAGAPERYVDVGHNPHAAAAVARWAREREAGGMLHAVCAMYGDKDVEATLGTLAAVVRRWYLAPLPPPRGADAARLEQTLEAVAPGAAVEAFADVESAWTAATAHAGQRDRVLAFGSFETARRVLRLESAGGGLDTS